MKFNGSVLKIPRIFCPGPSAHLILIENFEDKRCKVGRIALGEELFIDFLKSRFCQHSIWAIPHEALIPLFDFFFCDWKIPFRAEKHEFLEFWQAEIRAPRTHKISAARGKGTESKARELPRCYGCGRAVPTGDFGKVRVKITYSRSFGPSFWSVLTLACCCPFPLCHRRGSICKKHWGNNRNERRSELKRRINGYVRKE